MRKPVSDIFVFCFLFFCLGGEVKRNQVTALLVSVPSEQLSGYIFFNLISRYNHTLYIYIPSVFSVYVSLYIHTLNNVFALSLNIYNPHTHTYLVYALVYRQVKWLWRYIYDRAINPVNLMAHGRTLHLHGMYIRTVQYIYI